jgi:16S rRNA (uracil1498-N3)-methyltransferase
VRRRFFVEQFGPGSAALRGEQAHHLGRVLRAEPGQVYELSDGRAVWLARVERVTRGEIGFQLIESIAAIEPPLKTTLLLSVVKFDRFEWALEKATEMGVETVVPLAASRSERDLLAAAPKRAERWQKILLDSAQQSRRLRPPALAPLQWIPQAFSRSAAMETAPGAGSPGAGRFDCSVILSEAKNVATLRQALKGHRAGNETFSARVAIGPEGGWTDAEVAAAIDAGFVPASLGANILRTETAVVAVLAAMNYALCS